MGRLTIASVLLAGIPVIGIGTDAAWGAEAAQLPLLTVKDGEGDVVAPVVGFHNTLFGTGLVPILKLPGVNGSPFLMLLESGVPQLDLYLVDGHDDETTDSPYFELADCDDTGNVYLFAGVTGLIPSTTFTTYALGVALDGNRRVYGADTSGLPVTTMAIASRYNAVTFTCEAIVPPVPLDLYVATEILDITKDVPPPYSLK